MLRKLLPVSAALLVAAAAACSRGDSRFPALADEYVYTSLSFSPSGASQVGLHVFVDPRTRDTLRLDALLDDYSAAALDHQRAYYRDFATRLGAIRRDRLEPQTQADYDLLDNAVKFASFSLDSERFYQRRPQLYAEILGSALFANISLEYADTAARARDLTTRVEQIPAWIGVATRNLTASNEIYRKVALEEMAGVADLLKNMGTAFVKGTPSQARYQAAQGPALAALAHYAAFVRDTLPRRAAFDWRMGRGMFEQKWRYYLQASVTPEEMLRSAEDSMRAIRHEMLQLADPLYSSWFPGKRPAGDSATVLNAIVGRVLGRIGEEHANRDSLVEVGQRTVADLERFVVDHHVLSQTDFSNLKVIPTPVFERGSYGVGGAVFAPALQPNLSAFYWVTPIPKEWKAADAEAKLREYNKYKMLSLTIHEAMPGHIVQGDYANRVTPEWRRLLRTVYGLNSYIEGWAVYMEQAMEELGANGGDAVKARLVALKADLRMYANVIIDVRLHTMGMNGDSAVALMVRDAFQERPEATAKLQRAQLDYVQLNTYPVGVREWWDFRRAAEAREGSAFNLCRFHDLVLSYGPIPVPAVRSLYFAKVAPTATMPPSRCEAAGG
ncbi:MAG TPA: DUF885 domain-containing protein [Gemmatimonadales bacterium]|nr:DUF885 domain-containing protein [Gemmatimonadales bacterium]